MSAKETMSTRQVAGFLCKALAMMTWLVSGIYGLMICMEIIAGYYGFLGVVIATFLFPLTYSIVPFYEIAVNSNWFPAQIIYGGLTSSFTLFLIGEFLKGEKHD